VLREGAADPPVGVLREAARRRRERDHGSHSAISAISSIA
jgi:hypothetical protein